MPEKMAHGLKVLRDRLLPTLMNGQVVVGEAEGKVPPSQSAAAENGLAMAAEGAGRRRRRSGVGSPMLHRPGQGRYKRSTRPDVRCNCDGGRGRGQPPIQTFPTML